jgi:hypothetical protein
LKLAHIASTDRGFIIHCLVDGEYSQTIDNKSLYREQIAGNLRFKGFDVVKTLDVFLTTK